MSESLFVKCVCSCAGLEITKDEDDEDFYVTPWIYGRGSLTLGLKERVRWCWNIIRTGQPWSDFVLLRKEDAMKVAEFITKNSK